MEKVVAFVPIKLNNQRLPGKNLMELDGRPLCDYIFQTLNRMDSISEKYVYCSNERITEYMPENLTFLKRDSRLDGPEVRGLALIDAFVNTVDADVYILTHVTMPFTKAESIQISLDKVLYEGYDSAFSCTCIEDYCWYKGKPVNYDMKDVVTTQDLEPIYMETGSFFIFRKEVFTKLHQRIGENPYLHVMDWFEAVDIDTREDFEFAQAAAFYKNHWGNKE